MRIFYAENKQTGQLIFFVFGHFDQNTKNENWNEPNIYINHLKKKIPGEFVVVHVQNSQEAVSGKNSTMNFTHIVVGDIEP